MNIRKFVESLHGRHVTSPQLSLANTRENVLFGIILSVVAFGFIAYIPSMIGSIYIGYIDTALIDTFFYFWAIFLLLNKEVTFKQRTIGLILPIWILSIYLVMRFGITGAGFLWLLVAPTLGGALLGFKAGFILLFLMLLSLLGIGWAISYRNMFGGVFGTPPILAWSIMSGNAVVLGTLIMVPVSIMLDKVNKLLRHLDTKNSELSLTQDAMIDTFASLVEYRDNDTGHHIERTGAYVRIIAEHLRLEGKHLDLLTPRYIELLTKSAPLHDIGKIGVPDSILLKPGKLTPEEFEVIKQHTTCGRDALLQSERKLGHNSFLNLAAEIAYTHQERWDGSGYPRALKGGDIPLSGRIVAVADVYDALTSERPYRKPMSHEQAISYLQENSGTLFDPDIIDLLPEISRKFHEVNGEES